MEAYQLEKSIWDDSDFSEMGWHDATVWSMLADIEAFEFTLDLDYIFKWVHPADEEGCFRFWVAPVTMVFANAHDIKVNIESRQGSIEIADLHREDPAPTPNGNFIEHTYRMECQEGEISLKATGYKMYVRRPPELRMGQRLGLVDRDGVSFERVRNSM